MVRRRVMIAVGGLLLLAAAWWWLRPGSQRPAEALQEAAAPPQPAQREAIIDVAEAPGPAAPSGELAAPGAGEPFTITVAGGMSAPARLWRAASPTAPLLLLLPDDATAATEWQALVEVLRQVRDYHLVAWEGPGRLGIAAAGGGELRHLVVAEAALAQLRRMARLKPSAFGLIGVGKGGAAALLLLADRDDLKAAVAISPPPRLGTIALADVLAVLGRRQLMAAAAKDDLAGSEVLASLADLPHARRVVAAGDGQGLALLKGDPRLAPTINGWLFAAMGPVAR